MELWDQNWEINIIYHGKTNGHVHHKSKWSNSMMNFQAFKFFKSSNSDLNIEHYQIIFWETVHNMGVFSFEIHVIWWYDQTRNRSRPIWGKKFHLAYTLDEMKKNLDCFLLIQSMPFDLPLCSRNLWGIFFLK